MGGLHVGGVGEQGVTGDAVTCRCWWRGDETVAFPERGFSYFSLVWVGDEKDVVMSKGGPALGAVFSGAWVGGRRVLFRFVCWLSWGSISHVVGR